MTDTAENQRSDEISARSGEAFESDYSRLRSLLLGPDYEEAIYDAITREKDAERVATVLSEATKLCANRDDSFGKALAPVINKAIHESITRNPSQITNAISPIMGPAIRKAVAMALRDMVQSLNSVLEQSLSPRGILWRFKAWRAGVSYGRYVMSQTLNFAVEQVLLVHKETGLLLHSVISDESHAKDPELVSSMLTAIQDFVSDSFETSSDSHLDRVQVGDLTLHLISGSYSVLALAVRGSLSGDALEGINAVYERIQQDYAVEMESFSGERDNFFATEDELKSCLVSEEIETPHDKRKPWLAIVAIGAALAWLAHQSYWSYLFMAEQDKIVSAFQAQEEYVVIRHERDGRNLFIEVLRSPGSRSLEDLVSSLDSEHTALTIKQQKVTFGLVDIEKLDRLALPEPKPEPDLVDAYHLVAGEVQNIVLTFEQNSAILTSDEGGKLSVLIEKLKQASEIAGQLELGALQIMVQGFSDYKGTEFGNLNVSRQRAELVRTLLIENGVARESVIAWGLGHKDLLLTDEALQRRVVVQLILPGLVRSDKVEDNTANFPRDDKS